MSPWGKYIAMGATHLVLRAFEEKGAGAWPYQIDTFPLLGAARALAKDQTLQTAFPMHRDNILHRYSVIELQRLYADFVARSLHNLSPEEERYFSNWMEMLHTLEENSDKAARELD